MRSYVRGVIGFTYGHLRRTPAGSVLLVGVLVCCFTVVKHSFGYGGKAQAANDADLDSSNTAEAAIIKFWNAYHGNEYGQIPELQHQLEGAIQADPNNPILYALLGATHFWHVGEYTRDPHPDPNVLKQDMPTAAGLFQRAYDLDYHGHHRIGFITDDHLPGYWGITTVHTGQQNMDSQLVTKGENILNSAVYQFPEFNDFNRWAAHNADPKDSDAYRQALDSLWQGIDNCIQGSIDRSDPDLKPYLHLYTSLGRKKACWWDGDLAPYSFEGYMLNLGNGLVKAGQINAARIMFANAHYATNYETWPYRAVLEAVESSDLYARAALYDDNNLSNDPPLGVPNRSCVYCHATVPEPAAH